MDSVYADPGALTADPAQRGEAVRCATEPEVSKAWMQSKLGDLAEPAGAPVKPLTSDARVFRIQYKTTRGDAAGTPAVSSALVYIPKTPRAERLPIVVAARGSRGQAERCAVTKLDPALSGINDDAYRMVLPLVGSGFAVILPDLAGYTPLASGPNPPSGYAAAVDVARGTLDASRALKKLFPSLDDKVVLVGHSQGGHSALAALSLAESYGAAAPVVAVATYAPLWFSQRSWGALLQPAIGASFPLASSTAGAVSVWYHYTHAELLDGPGEGKKLFAADKQAAIEAFVKNECWGSQQLTTLGTFASDLFDPTFTSEVGYPAALGSTCDPGSRCEKWINRYVADRPHLTGAAATTPLLVTYGLGDTTIPPNRMRCAVDRLVSDQTKLTFCADAERTHGGIVSARGDYVSDWIASITLGTPAPAACATNESALTEACATPPPND